MSRAAQQLPHVPAREAVDVAFAALDGIQGRTPGVQVAGVFVLAYVMAQQAGLDVSELFNQSQRRFDNANTPFTREAQALSDYVNGELR